MDKLEFKVEGIDLDVYLQHYEGQPSDLSVGYSGYDPFSEIVKVTLKGDERNILELINADVFAKIEELCGID